MTTMWMTLTIPTIITMKSINGMILILILPSTSKTWTSHPTDRTAANGTISTLMPCHSSGSFQSMHRLNLTTIAIAIRINCTIPTKGPHLLRPCARSLTAFSTSQRGMMVMVMKRSSKKVSWKKVSSDATMTANLEAIKMATARSLTGAMRQQRQQCQWQPHGDQNGIPCHLFCHCHRLHHPLWNLPTHSNWDQLEGKC